MKQRDVDPADDPPADSTGPAPARPGAPRNNRNAERTGAHGKRLARLKLSHNVRLDSYEQDAVTEARAILRELSLEDAAIGHALGRQYARLEVVAARLVAMVKSRGMRDRSGRLKGEVGQLVDVVKALLDRLERLMRQAAENGASHGIAATREEARAIVFKLEDRFPDLLEFRCFLSDGSPVHVGGGDAPRSPVLADPLALDPLNLPAPLAAPAVSGTLLPAHPLDTREAPVPEPVPTGPKVIESRLARNWRLGLSPDGYDDD